MLVNSKWKRKLWNLFTFLVYGTETKNGNNGVPSKSTPPTLQLLLRTIHYIHNHPRTRSCLSVSAKSSEQKKFSHIECFASVIVSFLRSMHFPALTFMLTDFPKPTRVTSLPHCHSWMSSIWWWEQKQTLSLSRRQWIYDYCSFIIIL